MVNFFVTFPLMIMRKAALRHPHYNASLPALAAVEIHPFLSPQAPALHLRRAK
jgi:hypothetical protein